jgi:hypothetical protein
MGRGRLKKGDKDILSPYIGVNPVLTSYLGDQLITYGPSPVYTNLTTFYDYFLGSYSSTGDTIDLTTNGNDISLTGSGTNPTISLKSEGYVFPTQSEASPVGKYFSGTTINNNLGTPGFTMCFLIKSEGLVASSGDPTTADKNELLRITDAAFGDQLYIYGRKEGTNPAQDIARFWLRQPFDPSDIYVGWDINTFLNGKFYFIQIDNVWTGGAFTSTRIYVNNALLTTSTATRQLTDGNIIELGRTWTGNIESFLWYNQPITKDQRDQNWFYYKNRYNL